MTRGRCKVWNYYEIRFPKKYSHLNHSVLVENGIQRMYFLAKLQIADECATDARGEFNL